MPEGQEERTRQLAIDMIEASRQTKESVDILRTTIQQRRLSLDGEIKGIRAEVRELRQHLVGARGDNGLTSRVMLLEKQKNSVTWQSIGVVIALAIAALGLFLR